MRWERIDWPKVTPEPQLGDKSCCPSAKVKACIICEVGHGSLPFPMAGQDSWFIRGSHYDGEGDKSSSVNSAPDLLPSPPIAMSLGQRDECEGGWQWRPRQTEGTSEWVSGLASIPPQHTVWQSRCIINVIFMWEWKYERIYLGGSTVSHDNLSSYQHLGKDSRQWQQKAVNMLLIQNKMMDIEARDVGENWSKKKYGIWYIAIRFTLIWAKFKVPLWLMCFPYVLYCCVH